MRIKKNVKIAAYTCILCFLSLGWAGCDSEDEEFVEDVELEGIVLNNTIIGALNEIIFTFDDGAIFDPSLANTEVELNFNTAAGTTTFTLTSGDQFATGTVFFGSCTLDVTGVQGGDLLPVGTNMDFIVCEIDVFSVQPIVDDGSGEGSVEADVFLTLETSESSNKNARIRRGRGRGRKIPPIKIEFSWSGSCHTVKLLGITIWRSKGCDTGTSGGSPN